MDFLAMEALVTRIQDEYDAARTSISDLSTSLESGVVPEKEYIAQAAESLQLLRSDYEALLDALAETSDTPAKDLRAMLKLCREQIRTGKASREKTLAALRGFLSVQALEQATQYEAALLPLKEQVSALLDGADDMPLPQIAERSAPFCLFMEYLQLEDQLGEKGEVLLEQLLRHEVISKEIFYGIIRSKYMLPPQALQSAPQSEAALVSEAPRHPKPVLHAAEEVSAKDEPLLRLLSEHKPRTPNVSRFRKDMSKCPRIAYDCLFAVAQLELASPSLVRAFCLGMNANPVSPLDDDASAADALNRMEEKGLLDKYDAGELGELFALSPYGVECLSKKTIQDDVHVFAKICHGPFEVRSFGRSSVSVREARHRLRQGRAVADVLTAIQATFSKPLTFLYPRQLRAAQRTFRITLPVHNQDTALTILPYAQEAPPPPADAPVLWVVQDAGASSPPLKAWDLCLRDGTFWDSEGLACFVKLKKPSDSLVDPTPPSMHAPAPISDPPAPAAQDSSSDGEVQVSRAMAQAILERGDTPASNRPAFLSLIDQLLCDERCVREGDRIEDSLSDALVLADALYLTGEECYRLPFMRLVFACDSPLIDHAYTGDQIIDLFGEEDPVSGAQIAAVLRALFAPDHAFDFALSSYTEGLFNRFDEHASDFQAVKPVFNELLKVTQVLREGKQKIAGFTDSVLAQLGNERLREERLIALQRRAEELLDCAPIKARMKGLYELRAICFGPKSDLYQCMRIIADDDRTGFDRVFETLHAFFDEVEPGVWTLAFKKIENFIDQMWEEASLEYRTNSLLLMGQARGQVRAYVQQRLKIMSEWVETVEDCTQTAANLLLPLRERILSAIEEAEPRVQALRAGSDRLFLLHMLRFLRMRLQNRPASPDLPFEVLLRTGFVSLNDDGLPVLNPAFNEVPFYEPWRCALRHVAAPVIGLCEMLSRISTVGDPCYDNLRAARHICSVMSGMGMKTPDPALFAASFDNAKRAALGLDKKNLIEELELAYTYGRISEESKEGLAEDVESFQDAFMELRDFGCWRAFLDALRQQMQAEAQAQGESLLRELAERRGQRGASSPFLDRIEAMLSPRRRNYAVAEEYLNRYDNGETSMLPEEADVELQEIDSFAAFTDSKMYDALYRLCIEKKSRPVRSFARDLIDRHAPADWSAHHKESSERLLLSWIKGRGTTPEQLSMLLRNLGFDVKDVVRDNAAGLDHDRYELFLNATQRDLSEYPHPIAAFGTQVCSPLKIICLYGVFTAKQLVDIVTGMHQTQPMVVLVDSAMKLETRRQCAEMYHGLASPIGPYLLIDRVLLLFLALQQETERFPTLLKCTLPFTFYQPFTYDGGSTPDEMFFGRKRELRAIIDPGGTCIVYGGRQLGKTAILERARSLRHHPDRREFAVYVNASSCGGPDAQRALAKVIAEKMGLCGITFPAPPDLQTLCLQIEERMREGAIASLLLLLDEADAFLASFQSQNYEQLLPLVDLKRESKNRFKFVLAGLHDVCRAKALRNNGVIGQLGTPLCIGPLSPLDARRLLARPLQYIGFNVHNYPHLELILTNTNYYPGVLQFFGYTLVQTLTDSYSSYYRAINGQPPFDLKDEQLQAILASKDLNTSIRNKLRLTLEQDPRYFMLARCIVWRYYSVSEHRKQGVSIAEIQETSHLLDIRCLSGLTGVEFGDLLGEMREMGILSSPLEGHFRLRRHSFLNVIGKDCEHIEADILDAEAEGGETHA